MSHAAEMQDAADHREFLAEGAGKVALLNKAIDALIDLADAGLGGPATSDALRYINDKRSVVEREYSERA